MKFKLSKPDRAKAAAIILGFFAGAAMSYSSLKEAFVPLFTAISPIAFFISYFSITIATYGILKTSAKILKKTPLFENKEKKKNLFQLTKLFLLGYFNGVAINIMQMLIIVSFEKYLTFQ